LFPLIGGVILAVLFVTTLIDSMDPAYGSGSQIGGIGIVFMPASVRADSRRCRALGGASTDSVSPRKNAGRLIDCQCCS
jgi:hypothetical protein